ncbi:MAG TPA: ABC transporter ATP-binding protein [Anaerolineae bacterium]|nr:ABC transporter ATP-binding protein [Anaerolineae bacterium]
MELQITNLSKRYDDKWALRDISLRCGRGMIGLVGPNGAGKTTLMRIIATLIPPTSGSVSWDGHDTRRAGQAVREVLGYLPQEFGLYGEFSGRQFLRYLAAIKGIPNELARARVDEVIELVNLEREADRQLSTYSGGMKQRIGIAQALLNDPELLIVDEPTAGLDPAERVRFRTLLASLTGSRLIILSTHVIGDVEAVANRIVILQGGQMIADTTPDTLLERATGNVWSLTTDSMTALHIQAAHQVSAMLQQADGITLRIVSTTSPHPNAVPIAPSLEDAYLLVVGKKSISI